MKTILYVLCVFAVCVTVANAGSAKSEPQHWLLLTSQYDCESGSVRQSLAEVGGSKTALRDQRQGPMATYGNLPCLVHIDVPQSGTVDVVAPKRTSRKLSLPCLVLQGDKTFRISETHEGSESVNRKLRELASQVKE